MNNPNAKNLNWRISGITLVMQFLLLGALSYPVMAQARYTVTDIGPLNDINDQAPGAACVNNAGVVVG